MTSNPSPAVPPPSRTPVATLRLAAPGRVVLGVPVAAGVKRSLGAVRVGPHAAQGDNAVIDLAGWVRWFQLSAIVPAGGDYTIEVDDARETADGVDAPRPAAVIVADGASGDSEHARLLGTWRRGPV